MTAVRLSHARSSASPAAWVLANKSVIGTEKAAGVAELINWITLDDSENGLQYMWANGTLYGEGGTKDTVQRFRQSSTLRI